MENKMITIYGSAKSSAGRCYWCLEEVGVPYKAQSVNFKEKEHKSDAYLKLNPNGKVPCMQDGDLVLWESMAINLYLCEKYKPSLLGSSVEAKAQVYQWSIWAIAELQPPLIEAFIQLVFVPEAQRNLEIVEKAKAKLPNLLTILENKLAASKYLTGTEFTLADLNVASVVQITSAIGFELDKYSNIQSWRSVISERAAFQNYLKLLN
jgi:glutathione S-transferase